MPYSVSLSNLQSILTSGSAVNKAHLSADGVYIAVPRESSSQLLIYKWNGSTYAALTNPTQPTAAAKCAAFSPAGGHLAVGFAASPYLYVYSRSGDTFTKLANPPAAAGTIRSLEWSPDSTHLVTRCNTPSPKTTIYSRSGDTFTKLTGLPASLTDAAEDSSELYHTASYSPDGTYLAMATGSAVYVFSRSGSTYTEVFSVLGALGSARNVHFSADGQYLLVSSDTTIKLYSYAGGSFTEIPGAVASIPSEAGFLCVAFTPNSNAIVATGNISGSSRTLLFKRSPGGYTYVTAYGTFVGYHLDVGSTRAIIGYNTNPYLRAINVSEVLTSGMAVTAQNAVANFDGYGRIAATLSQAIAAFKENDLLGQLGAEALNPYAKLPDPPSLPTDTANGGYVVPAVFAENDEHVIVFSRSAPYLHIYKRNGYVFGTKLDAPSGGNAIDAEVVSASYNGNCLALLLSNRKLAVYLRSADSYQLIHLADSGIDSQALHFGSVSITKTGVHIAVGGLLLSGLKGVRLFKRTGSSVAFLSSYNHPQSGTPEDSSTLHVQWSDDGMYLTTNLSYGASPPYMEIFKRSGDTLSALNQLTALSVSASFFPIPGLAWKSDGSAFVAAHPTHATKTDGLQSYSRSGDTFSQDAAPDDDIELVFDNAEISPDGEYLASGSAGLHVYKLDRTNKVARELSLTGTPPGGVTSLAWNPASSSLAVIDPSSDSLVVFNISGDSVTRISDPPPAGGTGRESVAWNHDGTSLALFATGTGDSTTIYNRSGDTFTNLAALGVQLDNAKRGDWNSAGTSLAVRGFVGSTHAWYVYNRSGDTFTKVAELLGSPDSTPVSYSIKWNHDGTSLLAGVTGVASVSVLNRSGDTFTSVATLTVGNTRVGDVVWDDDGQAVSISTHVTPIVYFERAGDVFTANPTYSPPVSADYAESGLTRQGDTYVYDRADESSGFFRRYGDNFFRLSFDGGAEGIASPDSVAVLGNGKVLLGTQAQPKVWDFSGPTLVFDRSKQIRTYP